MREIGIDVHERVEALVALRDAAEVLVDELDGLALATPYRLGQLDHGRFIRPRCRHGCKP
jgi:hypothetical protein